jgi:3-hydroxyanthranilate 3,4-dioxygenase
MVQMPIASALAVARELVQTGKQVKVLWQEEESLAFIAKGRDYRSEFHINPSHELMYQIKGTMNLHYRTPEGKEDVAVLNEGSVIYTPAGTPHSPKPQGW